MEVVKIQQLKQVFIFSLRFPEIAQQLKQLDNIEELPFLERIL